MAVCVSLDIDLGVSANVGADGGILLLMLDK